jgi:hypothetical protein
LQTQVSPLHGCLPLPHLLTQMKGVGLADRAHTL